MRVLALVALSAWLMIGAGRGAAQETPSSSAEKTARSGHESAKSEGEEPHVSPIWPWANFAILAAGLGYLIAKKGGPFFAARSLSIRQGIADAEKIRADAEATAAEVDRRLSGLEIEIEKLRASARNEQAAEAARLREQGAAELARVQEHAGREIESAGKAARMELKRYAAELAIDLAGQKIRRAMTTDVQAGLVDNFARNLELPSSGRHPNK